MGKTLSITATEEWRATHPGGAIGLLEMAGIENAPPSDKLNARKREIEARLREKYGGFTRQDFLALPVLSAYQKYYKQFDKTYHVLQQLESIVLKGKSLPNVSPAVDANFMAELETLVLTAGHDVAKLKEPVSIDAARQGDTMTQMNGTPKDHLVGDMLMRDADAVSCSIIYGQDNRSPITPQTTQVLYVAYAPAGVSLQAVESQLRLIQEYIGIVSPQVIVLQSRVLSASQ